jgi:diguanylate cyclase (GGDEF)-like protein/PAS domain S-box-containing protein
MSTETPDEQDCATLGPAGVALAWARALAAACPGLSLSEMHGVLQEPTERLIAALSGPCVETQAAADVGGQLVAQGLSGAQTLPRTFEVLGKALRSAVAVTAPESPCDRVIELLGALASGYVWALRRQLVIEQEDLKRALLFPPQSRPGVQTSEAWFRQVCDRSPVGIAISELGGRIVYTNPSMDDLLGYSPAELVGGDLAELFTSGQWSLLAGGYQGLVACRTSRLRVRSALCRRDNETVWVHLDACLLSGADQATQHVVTMANDLTDQYLLEQQLTHQSLHDLKTGLPNRQYLTTHLERLLARLAPGDVLTLMHLDLDGFTAINDSLGQDVGDHLLDVVARRLESVIAPRKGMAARLGADEYAILLEPMNPIPEIGALAEVINTALSEPLYFDGTGVLPTAAIGAVQRRAEESTVEDLLRCADATLRRVRGRGTRQWALYDHDLDTTDRRARQLATTLPGALETGQLQVSYQPVVTLDDQHLVGIEAAVCWTHPEFGLLPHDQCVQAAERTGAIHQLGQWLLRTAAEQALCWRQRISGDLPPVVVNLTCSQAQDPDLVAKIRAVMNETGLPLSALELRAPAAAIRTVTGELAGEAGGQAEDNLRVLTELGIRAGLYDFGGGIGGMRCLADLPIRTVRIAEPVSQQVAADPSRILSQTAHALVHIVRGAGIDVVGFPVDNAEQAACWPWIGANWAMGALFGKPGPPADIEPLIDTDRPRQR